MKPQAAFLVLMLALKVSAQDLGTCDDEYSDCHDNCSLRFGTSTKDDQRLKLSKCITKCQAVEQSCRDRFIETNVHQLDANAVKNADKHDDDLREDGRKKPVIEDDPPAKVSTRSDDSAPRKKTQTREEDLPKRTATRVSDLGTTKSDTKSDTASEPKPEPRPQPEARAEAKPEPQPEKRSQPALDSSVRDEDEKPKTSEAKAAEKKKSDTPTGSKSSRKALDEWDPDSP